MSKRLALFHLLNLVHFIDEYYFGFPEWATEHFGTTSKNYYLASHTLILVLMMILFFFSKKYEKDAVFYMLVVQVIFFTNGFFHIATTFLWKEHSPGLLSQLVIFPLSLFFFHSIKKSEYFSSEQIIKGSLLGVLVSVFIIASLYLNIGF